MAMKNITEQFVEFIDRVNSASRYAILQTPLSYSSVEIEHMIQTANYKRVNNGSTKIAISPSNYLIVKNGEGIELIDHEHELVTYTAPALFSISSWFNTDDETHELAHCLAQVVHDINWNFGEPIHAEYSMTPQTFAAALNRKLEFPKTVPLDLKGNHDYWRDAYYETDDDDADDDDDDIDDDDADREAAELEESRRERLADIRAYYYDRI